jgi:biopolymer transport protein ExbB
MVSLNCWPCRKATPQNKFGFAEALEQGGFIAYATVVILGVMSFGSFYILYE